MSSTTTPRPLARSLRLGLIFTWAGVLISLAMTAIEAYDYATTPHSEPIEASPDLGISSTVGEHYVLLSVATWLVFGVPTIAAAIGTQLRIQAARVVLMLLLPMYALGCGTCSAISIRESTSPLTNGPAEVSWHLDVFTIGAASLCALAVAAFVCFLFSFPKSE